MDSDTTSEAPDAILHRAEQAYGAGRAAEADALYALLADDPERRVWSKFGRARIARDAGDAEAAIALFQEAIAIDPALLWGYFELAALLSRRTPPPDTLPAIAGPLLRLDPADLTPPHYATLQRIGHALWDMGRREAAAALFLKIWPAHPLDALALVRVIEQEPEPETGRRAFDALQAASDIPPSGTLVLARYCIDRGDPRAARGYLERYWRVNREDFGAYRLLIRLVADQEGFDAAEILLDAGAGFADDERLIARFEALAIAGDPALAAGLLRSPPGAEAEIDTDVGIALAYRLEREGDMPARDLVVEALRRRAPDSAAVAALGVNVLLKDHRWADALALYEGSLAGVADKTDGIRLTAIDVLAFNGLVAEARALLDRERTGEGFTESFVPAALRVFAEQRDWNAVLDAGIPHVGGALPFGDLHKYLIRAARAAGRQRDLYDACVARRAERSEDGRRALLALVEDLATAGDLEVLRQNAALLRDTPRLARIEAKLRGVAAMPVPAPGNRIFYCVDADYVVPAFVSIVSLLASNPLIARDAALALLLPDEVIDQVAPHARAVAARFGIALELVSFADVGLRSAAVQRRYGLFTGGHELPPAAYARIHYADLLAADPGTDLALYIDADTIVRPGLAALFDAAPASPLTARADQDRAEVRLAKARLGIAHDYFNSGVLLFDLRDPRLPPALASAIRIAQDPAVPLVYHDQCALNMAFDGLTAPLPPRFNAFRAAGDADAAPGEVIVHYLDRPKPWDSMYAGDARAWFEWYDLLLRILAGLPPLPGALLAPI